MVELGVDADLEISTTNQRRKTGENYDEAEVPAVGDTEDTACEEVEKRNQHEADIDAHEFKDGLWMSIHPAGERAGAVLLPVEELQVLSESVIKDLAAVLVRECLVPSPLDEIRYSDRG